MIGNTAAEVKAAMAGVKLIYELATPLEYVLDEPIAGVDPAARDYILQTIIGNYDPQATVMITTQKNP